MRISTINMKNKKDDELCSEGAPIYEIAQKWGKKG